MKNRLMATMAALAVTLSASAQWVPPPPRPVWVVIPMVTCANVNTPPSSVCIATGDSLRPYVYVTRVTKVAWPNPLPHITTRIDTKKKATAWANYFAAITYRKSGLAKIDDDHWIAWMTH